MFPACCAGCLVRHLLQASHQRGERGGLARGNQLSKPMKDDFKLMKLMKGCFELLMLMMSRNLSIIYMLMLMIGMSIALEMMKLMPMST